MIKEIILPRVEDLKMHKGKYPENSDSIWYYESIKQLVDLPHEKYEDILLGCGLQKNNGLYILGTVPLTLPEDFDASKINSHNLSQITHNYGLSASLRAVKSAMIKESGQIMSDCDSISYLKNLSYVSQSLIEETRKLGLPIKNLIAEQKHSDFERQVSVSINEVYHGKLETFVCDLANKGIESIIIHNHPFLLNDSMTQEEKEESKNQSRLPSNADKYIMTQINKNNIGLLATPEIQNEDRYSLKIESRNFRGLKFGQKLEILPVRLSKSKDEIVFKELYKKLTDYMIGK
jgi:hypothetical protein